MYIGLVGASNVGKSTLFNRLIRQFRAIVTDIHGTTKDILTETVRKFGIEITFADSPGLHTFEEELPFIERIIDKSDVVFFVIDHHVGIGTKEEHIHKYIMQKGISSKVVLVINKVDQVIAPADRILVWSDYYTLGYETIIDISAKNGKHLDEIWYKIEDKIDELGFRKEKDTSDEEEENIEYVENDEEETEASSGEEWDESEEEIEIDLNSETVIPTEDDEIMRNIPIAIVGKPNAGKSTLLNTLAEDYISKVQEVPGTTLDYVRSDVSYKGETYTLYDTAGIRKKSKSHGLEEIAYQKTLSMLKYIKPAVRFLIDGSEGLTQRDMSLLGEVNELGLPMIITINKSDLLEERELKRIKEYAEDHLLFVKHIPITTISALSRKTLKASRNKLREVWKKSHLRIGTSELNRIVSKEFILRPPRFPKNKICKIFYLTQVESHPPTFQVFINHKSRANFSFKRWLENTIRKHYDFEGASIRFNRKQRKQNEDRPFIKKYEKGK